MSFDYPWVLLLIWMPVAFLLWEWRRSARRLGLLLKCGAMLAILLALAQPRVTVYQSKVAVAILADTSRSVTPEDLKSASEIATRIERGRGRNWTHLLPFARSTRNPAPQEHRQGRWELKYTGGESSHGTDLETAVRHGIASLPSGHIPRILLMSDGHENLGSVARAIWQAQQLSVPIDVIPMAGRPRPEMVVESVSMPAQVFTGERFPVDVMIHASKPGRAQAELTAEGKVLGSSRIDLTPGKNHLRMHISLNVAGAIELAGKISAPGLGEARFENAISLRKPTALLVSSDPPGTEVHLLRTLEANQFEVRRSSEGVPDKLEPYQLIIFNNWNLEAISLPQKTALEQFVKEGGGLLWIAGERNVYVEKKGEEDALERTMPAKLAPPRTPEGTCVVLIIDKSSSMEGKKMELARMAAIGVVDNLRPIDSVGVLIFDNSFQWAVPIRKAEDRSLIKRLISGVTPDGGTQIAPALSEAYRKILPQQAVYKHVVLLTDGISEEGDSVSLAREAIANRVTISTVGLGQDVNRAFLEKVANFSQGKAYFLVDPSGLEQILLRDVMEHTGSTAVEKPLRAQVVKNAEILEGVGIDQAPPLRGYIRFTARDSADTILNADRRDPLLVRWQYGLGRSAVFTSDAKGRWAAAWVIWPGFDRLWANLFRDLLPHSQASEASAEFDRASHDLIVEYHLSQNMVEPDTPPDIYVFGPNGFRSPLKLTKMAGGYYRARGPIGAYHGLFRVRPEVESRAFPEVGFYRQEDELIDYGSNDLLLRQVAQATGGRFNPAVGKMFEAGRRNIASTMELWPGLLALAVALNLAELIQRKWRGLLRSIGLARQPVEA